VGGGPEALVEHRENIGKNIGKSIGKGMLGKYGKNMLGKISEK
jgi:hypothetical protein